MPAPPAWIQGYQALTEGVGYCDLGHRTQIEVRGEDRLTLLHNLCTNDILGMDVGEGREAYVTSVQGKILGHVDVWRLSDCCFVETVRGQASELMAHLDRYVIREDVVLHDRSDSGRIVWVAGPRAAAVMEALLGAVPPSPTAEDERLSIGIYDWEGVSLIVRRLAWTAGGGWAVEVPAEKMDEWQRQLLGAGALCCPRDGWEAARIEMGTPLFGRDITTANFPQEVDRDSHAISFTKGCYLGQETVARIDALGHVNQQLRGLGFCAPSGEGDHPPTVGAVLEVSGRPVATLTSVAWSPKLGRPMGLGYVRRGHNEPGTRLDGPVEVLELPV